jgi:hypothetical protein
MKLRYLIILFFVSFISIIYYLNLKYIIFDLSVSLKYEDWRAIDLKNKIHYYENILFYLKLVLITIFLILLFFAVYMIIKGFNSQNLFKKKYRKNDIF